MGVNVVTMLPHNTTYNVVWFWFVKLKRSRAKPSLIQQMQYYGILWGGRERMKGMEGK